MELELGPYNNCQRILRSLSCAFISTGHTILGGNHLAYLKKAVFEFDN